MSACAFPEFRPFKLTKKENKKRENETTIFIQGKCQFICTTFCDNSDYLSFEPTIKIMIIIQIAVLNKPISCFGLVKTELKDMRRIED